MTGVGGPPDLGSSGRLAPVDPAWEGRFWRNRQWWWRTGHTSAGLWSATILSFAATIVVARTLGPTEYGKVVLAVAVAALVMTFLDLTLEEAVLHHGSRALADGATARLRTILGTAFRVDLTVGLAVALGLVASADLLSDLYGRGRLDAGLVRLAALSMVVMTVDGTTGAVLLLARRPDLRAWAMSLTNVFRLGLVLLAVTLSRRPEVVLLAFAAAAGLGSAFQAALSWRVAWGGWIRSSPREAMRPWLRKLLSFGLHSSITTSVSGARETLIPLIVGRFVGSTGVGLLDVALVPIQAAGVLSGPFRMAILPEQARLFAEGALGRLRQSVRGYTLIALLVGIPAVVGGWFLMPRLVATLYSDAFRGAIAPARVLLVAALAQLLVGWSKSLPVAVGRPQARTLVVGLELALTVALLASFSGWGLVGFAWALSTTAVIIAAVWFAAARRLLS